MALVCVLAILSWRQAGTWKNSVTLFSRAVAVTEDNALANRNLGAEYYRLGRYREALGPFAEAVRIEPGRWDDRWNLGRGLLAVGRAEEAIPELEEALRLKPGVAETRYSLGMAYLRMGWLALAADELDAAVQAGLPASAAAHAHHDLGAILADGGDVESAERHFRESVRLKPDFGSGYRNLAVCLGGQGRWKEAREVLEVGVQRAPGDRKLAGMLGDLVSRRGQ